MKEARVRPDLVGFLLYWWHVPLQFLDSYCVLSTTTDIFQCLADVGGQAMFIKQVFWKPEVAKWHTHSLTRINTYTQRWHAGASLDGLLWWNLRAESSAPLGELNSGHRRVTVTGRGNPGQCLAPPPALPLWRPSWLGRSHWWEGHRPLSRSCSVDRERRVNGRAMRFIAFCPNSSSTKPVSKRALLLHCYCYCATNID